MKITNLPKTIADRYVANYQVIYLESDEPQRCVEAVVAAQEIINKSRDADIKIVSYDKWAGLHLGMPGIERATDATVKLINALPIMMAGTETAKAEVRTFFQQRKLFKETDDVIFIVKEAESELHSPQDGPAIQQFLKNIVAGNMCVRTWAEENKAGKRGQRLVVFVSAVAKLPQSLPEFNPINVPLPDEEVLRGIVDKVADNIESRWNEGDGNEVKKHTMGWVTPPAVRGILSRALTGLTYQKAEDALSLAIAQHGTASAELEGKTRTLLKPASLLEVIEIEKSIQISGVPGLEYIPRELTAGIELAGYEPVVEFINTAITMDPALMTKHGMKSINGITFVGGPGGGKTMIGYLMSRLTNRLLIKWSLGESKQGIVGASEAAVRRALQIGQAMNAVMLLDDIDKGMLGAGGSSGGDSGTTGNMVQMLLTEMSRPDNKILFCFTLNRVQNVPPELIRPGRMDEVFYVQRPDEATRLKVAQIHLKKRAFSFSDVGQQQRLHEFAYEHTADWSPAEIEAKIVKVGRSSIYANNGVFDFDRLNLEAKEYTPMAKQDAYKTDAEAMERYSQQFVKIGRGGGVVAVPNDAGTPAKTGRGKRDLI